MSQHPVLVTGASGNVGRLVVPLLLGAGVPVRSAVGSLERSTDPPAGPALSSIRLNFTEPATWDAAYDGVRTMFLLRPPQLGRPRTQMVPSLRRAEALGVQHVVLLSLQGAERNPVVPHAVLESWLRSSGMTWTFIRAAFFMQNLTTVHRDDIRERGEVVVPAGSGATAFVDAADVAAVAAAALLNPAVHRNVAWTPTGPRALRYDEVAAILSDVLHRPVSYTKPSPVRYARHARRTLGLPWGMVAVTTAIYSAARLGLADGITDDVRRVLNRPPVDFETFARREAESWQHPVSR